MSRLPISIDKGLKKLGQDLRDARKTRRIPMWLAAERAGISRATLSKIENGDGGVSMGAYARVFFVLEMIDRLIETADPALGEQGLPQTRSLPKRIRIR